jgi:hypothetical protein
MARQFEERRVLCSAYDDGLVEIYKLAGISGAEGRTLMPISA